MNRPFRSLFTIALFLTLALLSAACGGPAPAVPAVAATAAPIEPTAAPVEPAPAGPAAELEPVELTVFAAASLTDAFEEINGAFQVANVGLSATFSFAGSNQLAAQIAEGAPADVFASANRTEMEAAIASGRIDADAPAVFVTNELVIITPAVTNAGIYTLDDLAKPGILLVMAAAEVPAGKYALEFLDKASADPAYGSGYKDAVLANVVSYEENVRAVLNKVALGEADAGIVYKSDAASPDGRTLRMLPIDPALNVIAEYPIAVLNDSPHATAAAAFVDFVLSGGGQNILRDYGFGLAQQ